VAGGRQGQTPDYLSRRLGHIVEVKPGATVGEPAVRRGPTQRLPIPKQARSGQAPGDAGVEAVGFRAGGKQPAASGGSDGPGKVVHKVKNGRVLLDENHMDLVRLGLHKDEAVGDLLAGYLPRDQYKAFMDRLYTEINNKNTLSPERKAQALELYKALKQARGQSGNAGPTIEPYGPNTSPAEMDINRWHEGGHGSLEDLGGRMYEHWRDTSKIEGEQAYKFVRWPLIMDKQYDRYQPPLLAEEAFTHIISGDWRQLNVPEAKAKAALELLMREGHSYGPKIYRVFKDGKVDPIARKWADEVMREWQEEWLKQRGDPTPPSRP
jgi:hypothetical protein